MFVSRRASNFFQNIFKHFIVKRQVRIHVLALAILLLKLFDPFELIHLHATILRLPVENRGLRHAMLQ